MIVSPAAKTTLPGRGRSRLSPAPHAALPDYLVRHYRWAYIWRPAIWWFDHQPVISAILLGHYRKIVRETLRLLDPQTAGATLQIAATYGDLTPELAGCVANLHLIDVVDVQLQAARRRLGAAGLRAQLARMNAEELAYANDSFDSALIFFLLHEMPPETRLRTLAEAARVVRPGGHLVVAEYGEITQTHPIHRFAALRRIYALAEPFLEGFWQEDLSAMLASAAKGLSKTAERVNRTDVFGGFYRVELYAIS